MMSARRGSAFSADLGHVLAILGNALSAFPADLSHVLAIAGDGHTALSSHFLAGRGVHSRGSTRALGPATLHVAWIMIQWRGWLSLALLRLWRLPTLQGLGDLGF